MFKKRKKIIYSGPVIQRNETNYKLKVGGPQQHVEYGIR